MIEATNVVVFDDAGQVKGVRVQWVFDEMYSAWALDGLDLNGNGTYEPEELAPLAKDNVTNLKDYSYFTYADANGRKLEFGDITEYGLTYNGAQLTLTMTLPLKTTLNARAEPLSFSSYDPTFWIYIGLRETNPVTFEGKAPEGCGFKIKEPATDGGETYVPDDVAAKPENANIGAQFADTVSLVCAGAASGAAG